MVNSILTPNATEAARIELKSYNTSIPMGSLAIGVDNIHHDVFLSPRFVQASREYLFDLIRQHTKGSYVAGTELRAVKGPDHTTFRKLLTDFMQSAVTQAKFQKNIEIDLLFRLSLLKFLTLEIGSQFANLILEGAGHSAALHSNNEANIRSAGVELPISRLVVNQASSFTAGGSLTNGFAPTTTLGCGSWGGNSISENLDYKHLMNVSRIGKVIANKKVPTDEEIFA